MLDLSFRPERDGTEPLYRQLAAHLRELVEAGRLLPGDRLPASRELAVSLGLSRNTVNRALEELVDAGLLHSHVGRGTFVAARGPLRAVTGREDAPPRAFAWGGLLARRMRGVVVPAGLGQESSGSELRFDLRPGQVDPQTLPVSELRRALAAASRDLAALAHPADPRGWPPLREAVSRALVSRGIACAAEDVAIVNGAQQALDLVARVLVDPGETVAMEQPGYFGAALAFAACEAHVVGVGVDERGLRTAELARLLRTRRVKLLFTTPAVQSPTGVALDEARRAELLALADEHQLPILEDDYDSELRYGSPPVPALKNRDAAGQVIYVGTFSKALFPGIRVGYVVAPRPLLRKLVLARWAADFSTDLVAQAAVAELLRGGGLERHVRRVRKLYAERRAALLEALAEHMPEGTRWQEPAGGNAVWVTLPADVDALAVHVGAREAGIAYARGESFHLDGRGLENLYLSFARLGPDALHAAVEQLAAVARRCRTPRKRSA